MTNLSESQVRNAFQSIKRDMENMKTTLRLQRDLLDKRMHAAESTVMATVERKFFNGHKYLTEEQFDESLGQVLVQIDPVQEVLSRMSRVDDALLTLNERTNMLTEQQDSFITEKNAQFLLQTMESKLAELDARIPEAGAMQLSTDTLREEFSASVDQTKQAFRTEMKTIQSSIQKQLLAFGQGMKKLKRQLDQIETRLSKKVDKGQLLKSLK